jgi:hypothetical protein
MAWSPDHAIRPDLSSPLWHGLPARRKDASIYDSPTQRFSGFGGDGNHLPGFFDSGANLLLSLVSP